MAAGKGGRGGKGEEGKKKRMTERKKKNRSLCGVYGSWMAMKRTTHDALSLSLHKSKTRRAYMHAIVPTARLPRQLPSHPIWAMAVAQVTHA